MKFKSGLNILTVSAVNPMAKRVIFISSKIVLVLGFDSFRMASSISIERNATTKENLGFFDTVVQTINATKRPLIIFPQGTRTPSEIKVPFKKGVARFYEYLNIKCLPIALNSGNVWPKNGSMKSNGVITISILEPMNAGMEKNYFLQTLQENIYKEIDKINNLNN